eukprot:CAMPEP_0206373300 /NCGR_PEP_ID=MMETSP0294-20121207/7624_1 /ASSEMBLY_ACC=CAM_ASM_000327 /TAXON_ID=39354 /ORGANISM="Heterosigma akashiwo, Strain CCMP2393" /LENGTH=278 /DNA_ID=CAMNT_0053820847 /DNA_START=60 /DNA_END=893 /DNA_ORIENTATION=-
MKEKTAHQDHLMAPCSPFQPRLDRWNRTTALSTTSSKTPRSVLSPRLTLLTGLPLLKAVRRRRPVKVSRSLSSSRRASGVEGGDLSSSVAARSRALSQTHAAAGAPWAAGGARKKGPHCYYEVDTSVLGPSLRLDDDPPAGGGGPPALSGGASRRSSAASSIHQSTGLQTFYDDGSDGDLASLGSNSLEGGSLADESISMAMLKTNQTVIQSVPYPGCVAGLVTPSLREATLGGGAGEITQKYLRLKQQQQQKQQQAGNDQWLNKNWKHGSYSIQTAE